MRLTFRPLTSDRWDDLTRLFGPRGVCAGCWCMWWRRPHAEFRRGQGAGNRRAFRRVVEAGPPPGVLAYAGGEPVGWCALAPRAAYPRLARSRVLAPVDDSPVWSVTCFFVARAWRGRGVSRALLAAAIRFARDHGARQVEGYPVDVHDRRADAFVYPRPGFDVRAGRLPRGRPPLTDPPDHAAGNRACLPAGRERTSTARIA